jgi:23S rRNA-/tRNA-specific pseudouridylate synthase
MKWIIMTLLYLTTNNDLLRQGVRRLSSLSMPSQHHFCHAWTTTTTTTTSVKMTRIMRRKLHRGSLPRRIATYNHKTSEQRQRQGCLFHSTWTGDTAPFSEFAEHVQVAKEDTPVTVEYAILRSMITLGSSHLDGNDEEDIDGGNNSRLLIVEDDNDDQTTNHDQATIIARQLKHHPPGSPMTPRQLLHLGSIWYLSADDYRLNQQLLSEENNEIEIETNSDSSSSQNGKIKVSNTINKKKNRHDTSNRSVRPTRLSLSNSTMALEEGAYLRIHHTPRRFHRVYQADWSFPSYNNTDVDGNLPVVIQQHGPGYCIIEKPHLIPVHATVDNAVENIAHQLSLSQKQQQQQQQQNYYGNITNSGSDTNSSNLGHLQQNQEDPFRPPYMSPVQRLDINTSGLLVLATSPEFAAYFSQLLRRKTRNNESNSNRSNSTQIDKSDSNATSSIDTSITPTINYNDRNSSYSSSNESKPKIEKGYKCLVCIQSTDDKDGQNQGESALQAWQRLSKLQRSESSSSSSDNTSTIIKHYLKVSDRAPKEFVESIPDNDANDNDDDGNNPNWLECIMEITHVSEPIPLYAYDSSSLLDIATDSSKGQLQEKSLADNLWPKAAISSSTGTGTRMPSTVKAVAEVHVKLITGRTHQIRGQLSILGFPIVGDEQYGGAILPTVVTSTHGEEYQEDASSPPLPPQLLALQCCSIGFLDPDYEMVWHKKKRREILIGRSNKNDRWIQATLEKAWWTPFVDKYNITSDDTISDIDHQEVDNSNIVTMELKREKRIDTDDGNDAKDGTHDNFRPDLLPPSVQLSPGSNKYIVVKIRDPVVVDSNGKEADEDVADQRKIPRSRWFVQSAAPNECGGPCHANVANQLSEWIHCVPGYEKVYIDVTGGGRIDYDQSSSSICVYGYSYRFGKGDHARVAALIEDSFENNNDIVVTYDLSDERY